MNYLRKNNFKFSPINFLYQYKWKRYEKIDCLQNA